MQLSITLRDAEIGDLSDIVRVQYESQHELEFMALNPVEKTQSLLDYFDLFTLWNKRLTALKNSYLCTVAYENNIKKVVGYISYRIMGSQAYIMGLYIKPKYARLGIGSKLLINLLKTFFVDLDIKIVNLEVFSLNNLAINFYQKYGFEFSDFIMPEAFGGSAQNIFGDKYKVLQMSLEAKKFFDLAH